MAPPIPRRVFRSSTWRGVGDVVAGSPNGGPSLLSAGRLPLGRQAAGGVPRMHCLGPRTIMTCVAESTPTRPTRAGTAERRLRPNQEKAWHRPPDEGHASLISANCGFIPADWRAAQGRELPANARATRNDKAVASAKPSATATGRGKPSGLIAISPQLGAGGGKRLTVTAEQNERLKRSP